MSEEVDDYEVRQLSRDVYTGGSFPHCLKFIP